MDYEIIKTVISTVLPIAAGYMAAVLKSHKVRKQEEEQQYEAIILGLQALLQNSMLEAFRDGTEKGYATIDEKVSFKHMHDSYRMLGNSDSVINDIASAFADLPTIVPREGGTYDSKNASGMHNGLTQNW